ncbi:MAG: putative 2-aminoethylphosphonate ABC transporter permease subunit [Bacillota bacterium]
MKKNFKGNIRPWGGKGEFLQRLLIVSMSLWLIIAVVLPVNQLFCKAFMSEAGEFAGVANFIKYFSTPSLAQSLFNSLTISSITTVISLTLALLYAYALTRTAIPWKSFFKYMALLPLFAPTMMYGIGLIYLFGNKGIITTGFFGFVNGFDIHLYGPVGIIISAVIYTFPQALLILMVALAVSDYRLYEAAETLGAGTLRKFLTVTLPGIKYGLVSAFFVIFTLSFTDFGAPKVVGGQYNVLATDIYKQVIGQQNMTMGATVGMLLVIPAIIAFVADRIMEKKQGTTITAKSSPYRIKEKGWRDCFYFIYCLVIAGAIAVLMGSVVFAALVKVWPYNLGLTWEHFQFKQVAGQGLISYWNSVKVALLTAFFGTVLTFCNAYLIEKTRFMKTVRQCGYFLSILPLALPGLVIGLAYIFFFNKPSFVLPFSNVALSNPLHVIYGTIVILVLANIIHFYSVPFIAATTALKKLDKEIELVSESMAVPFYRTFFKVTVPMSLPAILEMAMYYFVNSMVTISAVIFLYAPDLKLASVAIVNMEDAGDVAPAAAMSVLILATNVLVRILYEIATKSIRKKTEAWHKR